MVNRRLHEDMALMLNGLSEQMRDIAEVQRKRSLLTATVTACEKRIEVTVNADGLLVETKFADDILDLEMDEIALNITAAVQQAAAKVAEQAAELMKPVGERRDSLPALSDIVDGAPDLRGFIPQPPVTPTVPPTSPEWPENRDNDVHDAAPPSIVADREL
ncbi:YbaB/EbfC family nucleoid-associated protein [Nocardia asteroides]|uniref:YbaB/EbfC family nucleoid-associated protein n=1 Tax=Nocardia asteroides TaxID=1824 RepID=UPI001E5EC497|nr:YbaB/EbfC family nucleoid-associated protein [Nocardia asteroides]UGT60566.1 YbaB/EbfC family nucleoid-associated protein [Nocardia asteroides]